MREQHHGGEPGREEIPVFDLLPEEYLRRQRDGKPKQCGMDVNEAVHGCQGSSQQEDVGQAVRRSQEDNNGCASEEAFEKRQVHPQFGQACRTRQCAQVQTAEGIQKEDDCHHGAECDHYTTELLR